MSEEVMRADSLLRENLLRENAALRAQLADVMRASDMEHARMAALIAACEVVAAFIESYPPDSLPARLLPTFYANLRVYGKNARAAVQAVRPQAEALLANMADLSRQIGEQNTTIGYQDAMLAQLRQALHAAEADVGWWHATVANYVTSATTEDRALMREVLADATTYAHPGELLLARLRLADTVVALARRHIAQSGIDADDRDLLSAIEDYEAGTKARDE